MKLLIPLLLLFTFFAIGYGGTGIEEVDMDPDDPSICVSKDEDIGRMKVGEEKTHPKQCVLLICTPGIIEKSGCGKLHIPEPYVLGPEDLSKPYPDCCPKPVTP